MKLLWFSKTFWVNTLSAILAAITGLMNAEWISQNPGLTAALIFTINLINVLLRYITSAPVTIDPQQV